MVRGRGEWGLGKGWEGRKWEGGCDICNSANDKNKEWNLKREK